MIDELHVKDVALIHEATLVPARGLTAITGETGAGKTALLAALKLLIGERADSSMVRQGADAAVVEGRVFPLRPREQQDGAEGLVVSRSLSCDGRSRVRVQDGIGSVGQLARTVGAAVDLCGQHEHQKLLVPANHRQMLDAWAGDGIADASEAYRACWEAAQEAASAVEAVQTAGKLDAGAIEQARYVMRRIGEANPQPGEYDELAARVPLLENAETLARAAQGAHGALSGEAGALEAIGGAIGLLEGAGRIDSELADLAESLREASYVIEDVSREARVYAERVEYDPQLLAGLQERMGVLQGLMRLWGPTHDDVLAAYSEAQSTVDAVEGYERRLAEALAAQDRAEEALSQAAEVLSEARAEHAPGFAHAVSDQMARLELGGATVQCSMERLPRAQWSASGADRVEFLFSPGAGMQARPLSRIASGGELSRVMLAIKVVLGSSDEAETLVFDEVDAGVGGSAARALADVLADLARTHQVIVVTHLAQVAVRAQTHYRVSKEAEEGKTPQTVLVEVEGDERVREVARMLSGDDAQESLAHARSLLDESKWGAAEPSVSA